MRSKLLRALAHLKAAARHIRTAKDILNGRGCYLHSADVCLSDSATALGSALLEVKGMYADAVVDALDPAELP